MHAGGLVVGIGILRRYVRWDFCAPEPWQPCSLSSLTGEIKKKKKIKPELGTGKSLALCVGFQMDGARK